MSTDHNYTNVEQSGADAEAERVGDVTGKSPTNKATDRDVAAKMANLLEGLKFPATKEEIRNHLNRKSPTMGNRINDALEAIENNLDNRTKYDNAYDVELAAGLVKRAGDKREKPHVRDRALNRANSERMGEEIRHDPYTGRETIGPANSKNVSPNTPKGEEV
jgi:hypothetical protein